MYSAPAAARKNGLERNGEFHPRAHQAMVRFRLEQRRLRKTSNYFAVRIFSCSPRERWQIPSAC